MVSCWMALLGNSSVEVGSVHLYICPCRMAALQVCEECKTRAPCMFLQLEHLGYLAVQAIIPVTSKPA